MFESDVILTFKFCTKPRNIGDHCYLILLETYFLSWFPRGITLINLSSDKRLRWKAPSLACANPGSEKTVRLKDLSYLINCTKRNQLLLLEWNVAAVFISTKQHYITLLRLEVWHLNPPSPLYELLSRSFCILSHELLSIQVL